MLLGREIDDPPRAAQRASFCDKHPANLDLMAFASIFVSKEVAGECLLEHEGDSLAHHSHRIDRIHQRFNRRFEKIALDESHHLNDVLIRDWWDAAIPCLDVVYHDGKRCEIKGDIIAQRAPRSNVNHTARTLVNQIGIPDISVIGIGTSFRCGRAVHCRESAGDCPGE